MLEFVEVFPATSLRRQKEEKSYRDKAGNCRKPGFYPVRYALGGVNTRPVKRDKY